MPYDAKLALEAAQRSLAVYSGPAITCGNVRFSVEVVGEVQWLTFAGTENLEDVVEDCEAICVTRDYCGEICEGDANAWDTCRDTVIATLDPHLDVQLAGHSAGSSRACIAAVELWNRGFKVLDVYSYGGKRTGNESWKAAWDKTGLNCFRFVNLRDPVPLLECWLPHVGVEVPLGVPGIPMIAFHAIAGYVSLLDDV